MDIEEIKERLKEISEELTEQRDFHSEKSVQVALGIQMGLNEINELLEELDVS